MMKKSKASLRALTAALVASLATAGCATSHATLPAARAPYQADGGRIVAASGLTEDDVRASIQAALSGNAVPRYVEVRVNGHAHVFAPTAEVVRTTRALAVKTALNVYLWDISEAHVFYSSSPQEVSITSIPFTTSTRLDGYIRPHGVAYPAMSSSGQRICADCSMLFGPPKGAAHPDTWQKLLDPWQVKPDYAPAPASTAQRGTDLYRVCEYDVDGQHCWYYGDSDPSQYYQNDPYYGNGGSGDNGGGPAITIPCVPVNAPDSIINAMSNNDFAKALAQAVAVNYGGKATTINNTPIPSGNNGADAAAEAHKVTNTIDWDQSRVDAASGGNANAVLQIFVHEELHLWYETLNNDGTGRPNPFPGEAGFQATRTVTLGDGTVLTFSISADASHTLSAGYAGFEHAIIHNALVGQFNTDLTGALAEAFVAADSVKFPNQAAQKFTDFASAKNAITAHNLQNMPAQSGLIPRAWPPSIPNANGGCRTTNGVARLPQSTRRVSNYAETVDGYTVVWDGAWIM